MRKFLTLSFSVFILTFNGAAQVVDFFESRGIKAVKDDISRLYLSPQHLVWMSDSSGTSVKNPEVLLRQGDGQTHFGLDRSEVCELINSGTDSEALVLDFGMHTVIKVFAIA